MKYNILNEVVQTHMEINSYMYVKPGWMGGGAGSGGEPTGYITIFVASNISQSSQINLNNPNKFI